MGKPKLDLPFGATTVLGAVIDAVLESSLREVTVVTSRQRHPETSGQDGVIWLENPDPSLGSVSSLLVASHALSGRPLLVLVGDQPGVAVVTIERLLAAWGEAQDPWGALTSYTDGEAHPLVLSPRLLGALEGEEGDKVLWPLLHDEAEGEVLRVVVAGPKPIDINSVEDYEAALRLA